MSSGAFDWERANWKLEFYKRYRIILNDGESLLLSGAEGLGVLEGWE